MFIDEVPEKDIIYNEKCTKIFYDKDFIDFPFQMNIHQLKKEEFIDCLYDLFNKEEKDKYDNFLDMLYGKFGKSITDPCLGWEKTEQFIYEIADILREQKKYSKIDIKREQ